jgi:hypothetical protein
MVVVVAVTAPENVEVVKSNWLITELLTNMRAAGRNEQP